MTGVNELAWIWDHHMGMKPDMLQCADDLRKVARTAWHPVSEPPTAEDAGGYMIDPSCVLIINDEGNIGMAPYWSIPNHVRTVGWARINDVVLMPPEDT